MSKHVNNGFLFLSFAALTGSCIAVIIWLFLKVCNIGVSVVWDYIPTHVTTPFYTVLVCLVGGLVIGLFHKTYGNYPETMADALKRVKKEKKFPYKDIPIIMAASFLSIFFGGAVGPETGLVSILLGLCFWAMDQFEMARDKMELLIQSYPDMSRFQVFREMAGCLLLPPGQITYTKYREWTKAEGVSAGLSAGLCGLLVFEILNHIFGRCITIPHLSGGTVDKLDVLFLFVLIVAGIAAGYLYMFFKKITGLIFGQLAIKGFTVINAILGGLILGIVGTFIPMTMFSGGNEMQIMQYEYLQYTPVLLIVIGVVKLFLTNVCIESGWRGGHFFPVIFSGLSIGYGMSILLGCNQVLSVVVVCAALLGTILQQPLGALALSVIFFPIEHLGWMLAASFIGGCLPMPKPLRADPNNRGFIYNISHGEFKKKLPMH